MKSKINNNNKTINNNNKIGESNQMDSKIKNKKDQLGTLAEIERLVSFGEATGEVMGVSMDTISSGFRFYGMPGINGSNLAGEPSHNAHSMNASEFRMFIEENEISHGNNGKSITLQEVDNYVIHNRKKIGARENDTGVWCVGGTTIFFSKTGLVNYLATKRDGKYFVYKWVWEWSDLVSDDIMNNFTFNDCNNINGLNVIEYELSHDEYKQLVRVDDFDNEPTFYISINRYSDCSLIPSVGNMINNLDDTYCSVHNFKYVINGREGSKVYFPTVYNGIVPSTYDELELVEKGWICPATGAKFDIYHYKYISDKYCAVDYLTVKKQLDVHKSKNGEGARLFGPPTKDSSCYNHFVNKEGLNLLSISLGASDLKGVQYNYSNMVFVLVDGDYNFATIKTEKLNDKLHKETVAYHNEYFNTNPNRQHAGNKGEDSKVMECFHEIMDSGEYGSGLISSIQELSGEELRPSDIREPLNHLNFKLIGSREHDWAVKKTNSDSYISNLEFMVGSEDWDHIDKLNATLDDDKIPYHTLIVDEFKSNKEKINTFINMFTNKTVHHIKRVTVVTLDDFMNGNINNFKIIFEVK